MAEGLETIQAPAVEASAELRSARAKLEFLLADLEGDVMLCSTREQHIRAVQRVESLKAALNVLT